MGMRFWLRVLEKRELCLRTMLSSTIVTAGMVEAMACCSANGRSHIARLFIPKSTATAIHTRIKEGSISTRSHSKPPASSSGVRRSAVTTAERSE